MPFHAETFYRRPLIPLTVALMFGIAAGSARPGFGKWALAVSLAAGAVVVFRLLRRRPAAVSPLLLFAALGYLSLQPWADPRIPENHVGRFLDTGPWRIVGVVDSRPLEFESRTRFVLRTERLEGEGSVQAVSGLLRVTVAGEAPGFEQGDRVGLSSRIRSIRNFNNPGGFDFKRSMAYRGILGSAFTEARGLQVVEAQAGGGWLGGVDRMRGAVSRLIDRAELGPSSAVLNALVIGERAHIPPETRQAFTATGTSHILAISGLHISLVATAAFGAFRWLLSWCPPVLDRGWARKGAALLTLLPATLYALIAGFSPATQRALLMVAVFLLAFLLERDSDPLNTLALAALGILAVQPTALFSISFQLSFAAVAAILGGAAGRRAASGRAPGEEGLWARLRRGGTAFLWVSLAATWGTLPLVMRYFNTISLISLPANVVAVPLLGTAAVAAGLAGTLLAAVSAEAALLCFRLSGAVISAALAIIEALARLPLASMRTVTPSWIEVALFYGCSGALVYLWSIRRSAEAPPGGKGAGAGRGLLGVRGRPGLTPALSLLAVSLLGAGLDAGFWAYERFGRTELRLTLLDVGQGSAVLLEFPGGETALVDGGGLPDTAGFDVGANVVAPFLWGRKIATVETLILTHPNSDHLNGLAFIAENFNVRRLWANGDGRPLPAYSRLMRALEGREAAAPALRDIPRRTRIGGAELEILHPPDDFAERRMRDRWRNDDNNNSLVVRVSFGGVSALVPGDIMRPAEKELAETAGGALRSTVLIAPHHGSRTSSSEAFLAAVAPQAVFISCADRPGSGLPHPQTLERYAARGIAVWRTDRNGAIRFATNGRGFRIEPAIEVRP